MRTPPDVEVMKMRVWRDSGLDRVWRLSYSEGEDETVVSFPDDAALNDFIAEQLGFGLDEEPPLQVLHYDISFPELLVDDDIALN
jgi:hypothetical protein